MDSRLIGKIVSRRFRVEDIIGRGGMAIVYRAYDLRTHQTVALKVLREEYENDPEYLERFKREAEVCKKLNHPNIVNMIASGNVGDIFYIAMEYVDGKTLKDIIAESGRLDQNEAIRCALQILAALAHAHQRGIIHRDVKPQNVMVSRTGQIKVGDFGIAGIADSKTLTSDGNVMGSVHYFSPEQAKGMRATAASDLYSVGVILYEMLVGHVPFEGETAVSVAMMHLMEKPKPVEEQVSVYPALGMIVSKALEKQPTDRYQNADAMTRDLRRALRHPEGEFMKSQLRQDTLPGVRGGKQKPKKPNRVLRIVMVAFVLALLGGIGAAGVGVYSAMFVFARVPDLSGLDEATAQRMTASAGLEYSIRYVYDEMQEGFVCDQQPKPMESLRRGETVEIVVSQGSGMVLLTRLTGMTQDEAADSLAAQGLALGDAVSVISDKQIGTVIDQRPEPGERLALGSTVDLILSAGRIVVPELTGQRGEEASSRIEAVGLVQGEVAMENVSDARQDGIVLRQFPEKFEEVLPGSAVDITVGYYEKRRCVANVTLNIIVPPEGVNVRVTLVGEDGKETDMYSATHTDMGSQQIDVTLRSENPGVYIWRLYLDGNYRSEAKAVLQ